MQAEGRNVVDTCNPPPDQQVPAVYKRNCRTAAPRTVCVNDVDYKNVYCAFCNGLAAQDVSQGACRSRDVPVIDTCIKAKENYMCRFYAPDPVCDDNGNTYLNRECAGCNGVANDVLMPGACYHQEDLWDPCASLSCPIHSSCAKLVADCDFEEDGTCGWTNSSTGDLQWLRHQGPTGSKFTGPSADHTLNDATGHFM